MYARSVHRGCMLVRNQFFVRYRAGRVANCEGRTCVLRAFKAAVDFRLVR
jgi:hypothetical protein